MTDLDIAKIKEAAERMDLSWHQCDVTVGGSPLIIMQASAYIQMCAPHTILALIARLEDAEASVPKRLCVLCGKEAPAHEIPHRGECKECPEAIVDGENYGRLCMFDMTAEEGMNYWKQKAHEAEARASTAYTEGVEAAVKVAENYRTVDHIAWDGHIGIFPKSSTVPDYLAHAIRALLKDKPNG